MVITHGYVTTNYKEALAVKGPYGEIVSGRWGQGAFPIILALTIVATLIWGQSLVSFFFFLYFVTFLLFVVLNETDSLTYVFVCCYR
jgi:hypothetical protein|tara:strand:+ start:1002 stop:1262 length:261 start_codon:yes stop_codon:yes gene_type:complete